MCGEFFDRYDTAKRYKQSLKYIILIFNKILEFLVISAVGWIGYSTESA